jgi:glucose-6-phosphate 1-dehydrogenase
VVLEKPLGHDMASNRAINQAVGQVFTEHQIYRIDHYLGKPSVQNLFACALAMRCLSHCGDANILPTSRSRLPRNWAWRNAARFTTTGALRDMVQNHALQLLCAIGMEPPINSHADAIRDEKLKVLRSSNPGR